MQKKLFILLNILIGSNIISLLLSVSAAVPISYLLFNDLEPPANFMGFALLFGFFLFISGILKLFLFPLIYLIFPKWVYMREFFTKFCTHWRVTIAVLGGCFIADFLIWITLNKGAEIFKILFNPAYSTRMDFAGELFIYKLLLGGVFICYLSLLFWYWVVRFIKIYIFKAKNL